MKVPSDALGKTASCVKCAEKIKITIENTQGEGPAKEPKPEPKKQAPETTSASEESLEELIVARGLTTRAALAEARLIQEDLSRTTWELLIDLGHLSGGDFLKLMSSTQETSQIDLKNYNIPPEVVDFVPAELIKGSLLFPVDKLGKLLTLAMVCPADHKAIANVEAETGLSVKAMLCGYDDVKAAIQGAFPPKHPHVTYDDTFAKELSREFDEIAAQNEVARRVFELGSLSPLDNTVKHVDSAIKGRDCSLEELTNIIALDPTSAVLLLTVANSAAYGFPKRVDNIGLASTLLGLESVRSVLHSVKAEKYIENGTGLDFKQFLKRARFCSEASKAIGTSMESQRILTAQAAGLLHEIGRISLTRVLPNSYPKICGHLKGPKVLEEEERVYHFSYAESGYMLARKLNLPPGLTEPIRYHRKPLEASKSKEVVGVVGLAVIMTDAYDSGEPLDFENTEALLESLSLTRPKAEALYRDTVSLVAAG